MAIRFSGVPEAGSAVPAAVQSFAAGAPITPVWQNEVFGLTFRVEAPSGLCYVKWNPHGSGESLTDERARLEWLDGRFPVPRVVASGQDAAGDWLATADLGAQSAVAPEWTARPAIAVRAIAVGLRALHDGVDASGCPFSWSVPSRLAAAAGSGRGAPLGLGEPPSIDRLVVCHGDPCVPNTLIADSGEFAAIVDVARVGVADRWADLAVATMSLGWNYGQGWEELFFASYGIEPDPVRIAYYRALWDAT